MVLWLLWSGSEPSAFEAEPPKESFRTGTLLVGEDIVPGRYFTNPKEGCYFARLSGLGGELSDILASLPQASRKGGGIPSLVSGEGAAD